MRSPRSLLSALRHLPLALANRFAGAAARLLDRAVPKLRRVGAYKPRLRLSGMDAGKAQRISRWRLSKHRPLAGRDCTLSLVQRRERPQWIGYEGLENYHSAKAEGRASWSPPLIWGIGSSARSLTRFMTEPMNVMVRPLDNPLIDQLVERRRRLSGNHLILKKDAARACSQGA